jgi:predicted aconitase with swiveling domain
MTEISPIPRTLAPGHASGPALVLDEPLSFWGGLDPSTGRLIDVRHPQRGSIVTARVLVMPAGRGSSSSSSVLAEAIRAGTAPAAIVLRSSDPIVALGAIVASELYAILMPVVVGGDAIADGDRVEVIADETGATIRVLPAGAPGSTPER